jgi:hypothetical protein
MLRTCCYLSPLVSRQCREDYVTANTLIRSRSYRVGIKDTNDEWQDAMCLVPLADLLNTGERGLC